VPGNLLDLTLEENSFTAIYALRFMHFLLGDNYRKAFELFYKWLIPNGVLVLSNLCEIDLKSYEGKLTREEWPSQFLFTSSNSLIEENSPKLFNLSNLDVQIREATRAGFKIFKGNYFGKKATENFYRQPSDDMDLYASIIAVK
jgi:hypothetical protein